MGFDRNVFINCPFDDAYLPMLRPLLFTVISLGFTPRIASESLDSSTPRIEKIIKLIAESRLGIHDLSRLKAERVGEYYRFNMPFELGIDVGCVRFGQGKRSRKRCLILEAERYQYQAALSDMSNSDIAVHKNEPEEIVKVARHWLRAQVGGKAPPPSKVWADFTNFTAANDDYLKSQGYSQSDIEGLPIDELIPAMTEWVSQNSIPLKPRRRQIKARI